jgi:DnaK suppressor protein
MPKITRAKTALATPSRTPRLSRHDTLKQALLERQQVLRHNVESRLRERRARRTHEGTDDLEHSEANTQNDLSLAVLQLQAETLVRIDAALNRLETGAYGRCAECDRDIAVPRLRALPFAVRCQACEVEHEQASQDGRRLALSRGRLAAFSDIARV